ncbi:Uncharacterised protein [Streptococcus pneumoniae]|nr:Uncharacterised protein [Streptococcus pneumoniae]
MGDLACIVAEDLVDQGSGCIESHGPANQAKYQSKFFKFLKRNGGFFGRSLGTGESRKSYRASRSSQQAFRRLEYRYLHAFA